MDRHPIQVVCAWMGNSQAVAMKHYLQVTEDHYRSAIPIPCSAAGSALQNPVQQSAAGPRTRQNMFVRTNAQAPANTGACDNFRDSDNACKTGQVPCVGLEPTTR